MGNGRLSAPLTDCPPRLQPRAGQGDGSNKTQKSIVNKKSKKKDDDDDDDPGSLAQKAKMAEDARRKKEMADKIKAGKK